MKTIYLAVILSSLIALPASAQNNAFPTLAPLPQPPDVSRSYVPLNPPPSQVIIQPQPSPFPQPPQQPPQINIYQQAPLQNPEVVEPTIIIQQPLPPSGSAGYGSRS